jgi:hypothetical protein
MSANVDIVNVAQDLVRTAAERSTEIALRYYLGERARTY